MERNPHLLLEGMLHRRVRDRGDDRLHLRPRRVRPRRQDPRRRHRRGARRPATSATTSWAQTFRFDVFMHLSAGRYLCGEASAMLNALEGKRANPRARPPHMTGAGLWGKPTVVNNVETLCCAPPVIAPRRATGGSRPRAARGGRHQAVHGGRPREAAGLVGAAAGHAHARDHRASTPAACSRATRRGRHPRRRLERLRRRSATSTWPWTSAPWRRSAAAWARRRCS